MPIVLTSRADKTWSKVFETRELAIEWINLGIECSEGSEQDRYYRILWKIEDGAVTADLYDIY